MLEYASDLSSRMAARLRLTAETIDSAAWLSAGMLNRDPAAAQEAACAYQEHLMRAPKAGYNLVFSEQPGLLEELGVFCTLDPPSVLWGSRGAFQNLFRFLALRSAGRGARAGGRGGEWRRVHCGRSGGPPTVAVSAARGGRRWGPGGEGSSRTQTRSFGARACMRDGSGSTRAGLL